MQPITCCDICMYKKTLKTFTPLGRSNWSFKQGFFCTQQLQAVLRGSSFQGLSYFLSLLFLAFYETNGSISTWNHGSETSLFKKYIDSTCASDYVPPPPPPQVRWRGDILVSVQIPLLSASLSASALTSA